MDQQKPYLKTRSIAQIKKLKLEQIPSSDFSVDLFSQAGSKRAIMITHSEGMHQIPGKYVRLKDTAVNQSAKRQFRDVNAYQYLHGQPHSYAEALVMRETPANLFSSLLDMGEDISGKIGFRFQPVLGSDRRQSLVAMASIAEGTRMASHAFRQREGDDSMKVAYYDKGEAAEEHDSVALVQVPSHLQGGEPYVFKYNHLPLTRSKSRWAHVWGIRAESAQGSRGDPMNKMGNIDFSDLFRWYSHHVAGYFALARDKLARDDNSIPLDMRPIPVLSAQGAAAYDFMMNNVLIRDKAPEGRARVRKPYTSEVSSWLMQCAQNSSSSAFFWDAKRDGPLKDYRWTKVA